MKKYLLISMLVAMGLTASSSMSSSPKNNATFDSPASVVAPSGTCRKCGGKLKWTATAKKEYYTCPSCKGTGSVKIGDRKTSCNSCNGTGKMYRWKSGNVCDSCGAIYLD